MDLRYNSTMRILSAVVLFFFTWTFGGLFDIAYAAKISNQQPATSNQQKEQKPEEKLEKTLLELEQVLADTSLDTDTKKSKVRAKKTEIEALDVEIKKQFSATEKKLKDEGFPPEILERHNTFTGKYDANLTELKSNLDAIDKGKDKKETDIAVEKTKKFLEKVKPPKKHTPLDPNKLPHRTLEPVFTDPREKPEEFTEGIVKQAKNRDQKPILIASNGSLEGLLASANEPILLAAANPPTTADLAETIEVKFTPAIQAKATELNHNPTKIYNWVRNNIEYVPTYGSIQGADYCLQTKQCNDFDTASLLIALLRASGIHARYVYGTVEIPIEKVKNWLGGFTDTNSAMTLIASGRIPLRGITSGGKIVSAQMEHVWVEAYIDYMPSRGARHKTGQGDTWIPLDPSFKQYAYTQGMDLKTAIPFNAQAFIDQLKSTATINETEGYATNLNSPFIRQTMQDYQTQVQNYITQSYPNSTLGEVFGKKEIIIQDFPYLLGTLPYKTIVKGATYASIPDSLRHKITFSINTDSIYSDTQPLIKTKSLTELAGKRITINYLPTSEIDAEVLAKYGYYSAPPYLVNLKPALFIEGVQEASGGSIGMGTSQSLQISFTRPRESSDSVSHPLNASAMVSIGLDMQSITPKLLEDRKAKLESAIGKLGVEEVGFDDIIGEILNLHTLSYFVMLEMFNKFNALGKIAYTKATEEMAAMINPSVEYLYGVPFRTVNPGLEIDVKRYVMARKSLNGDRVREINFSLSTGLASSALEQGVIELLNTGGKGVSAVKALSLANENGMPVYRINSTNSTSILQKLQVSPETVINIKNAVAAGKEVLIPERSIQYYQWVGDGYIVFDPNTGAGDFLISGGLFGGSNVCNLYAKNNIFKGVIADYWKHGSYRTLSGGAASDYCKNHVYDLVEFFRQSKDELLRWAAKAVDLSPEVAEVLRDYARTTGTIIGILMNLAGNIEKLKQLDGVNYYSALVFIGSLSFLTTLAIVWGWEAGGVVGGAGWMVGMTAASNEILEQYLNWLLSMQQSASFEQRRKRYAKNIIAEDA
jgi:hypothetical protein